MTSELVAETIEPPVGDEPEAPASPDAEPVPVPGDSPEQPAPGREPAEGDEGEVPAPGGETEPGDEEGAAALDAPASPPEGTGKLAFQCKSCGTWNDLIRDDVAVMQPQRTERFDTCPGCQGVGLVDTGSFVPGKGTEICPECQGNGYVDRGATGTEPPAPPSEHGQPPWPDAVWNDELKSWQ